MRFLFFTDTHIRGTNPKSRLDDFYLAVRNKFEEILQLADENNIDYILHGGDWFDRPDISPSIVREFAIIIKRFNRPVYTIAGNHDIYGHNPDTISRTMLGLLEGTGIINVLKNGEPVVFEEGSLKVQLYGHSYSYEIDDENNKDCYIVSKSPECKYCINMVHGMLLQKAFIEGIKYTVIDQITSTQADITLAGHYHSGFGIKKIDDKYFVNPGSLSRVSALKSEIERIPQVVIIDLGDEIDIRCVELKTVMPGEQVLDREHILAAQDRAKKLNNFFRNLDASSEFKNINMDINELIEEIVSAKEVSRKVKDEAIRRIEQARINLAGEEVGD